VLGYPETGNEIPFYMQPTLGGSSDLRGYRRYRFYDNNLFLLSAEYRWEVFTLMDAAVFMDAGKVFHRDGDFNLENLESDAGFGFRFKTRKAVVFRVDTAFSHEGFGLWITFDHVF
jgi:outer membrane protein assembly factor BamA